MGVNVSLIFPKKGVSIRVIFCCLLALVVAVPALAQKPKTRADTERVDWAEVFAKSGNRTEEFDWSPVLNRERADTERVDWAEVFGPGALSPEKTEQRPFKRYTARPEPVRKAPETVSPEEKTSLTKTLPRPALESAAQASGEPVPVRELRESVVPGADEEGPLMDEEQYPDGDGDEEDDGNNDRDGDEEEPPVDQDREPFPLDKDEGQALVGPGPGVQVAAVDENAVRERLTPKALYSKEFIDRFLEIALFDQEEQFIYHRGGEHRPKPKVLTKWDRDIKVKIRGELSPEDFRQASLLTSRIVMHLNDAASNLLDERVDEARKELEQAVGLVGVVRELLPTTTVTTVVHDADGKEVYRDVDRVQEDRIPLFEELIAVNVVEPITEAKEEAAELAGVRLAEADLLHTSVLVELGYVERKLNRALKLLEEEDNAEDAVAQLLLAQSHGVSFDVNKEDNPLLNAQMALQLAERMVEQSREKAAKANLQLAKNYLELYRGLLAKGESEDVRKLQGEITRLQGAIASKDAAETIRGFWNRVTSWLAQAPGEMRANTTKAGSTDTPERVASRGKADKEN